MIFNYIEQEQTLNLRLVCKTWNQEIQNYYEFVIYKLDEDSPDFQSILQLRVKEVIIHKLETTPALNPDGTSIFKHRNAIRRLELVHNARIPQWNLYLLLGSVAESIRDIYVYININMCNYQFAPNLAFSFKRLKFLYIWYRSDQPHQQCEDNPRGVFQVFENSSFPELKELSIMIEPLKTTVLAKARIISNVLRIVANQGRLLEFFQFNINRDVQSVDFPVPLTAAELARIKEIDTLEVFELNLEPLGLATRQFWEEFLLNQTHLKKLFLLTSSPIYPLSIQVVREIILNNSATLEEIGMTELNLSPTAAPFDLSIFENSLNLKILVLRQHGGIPFVATRAGHPDISNFPSLPPNIIDLEINTLKILSDELLTAFHFTASNSEGFQKLQRLNLMNCGNKGRFGFNEIILYQIMLMSRPSLIRVRFQNLFPSKEKFELILGKLRVLRNKDLRLKRKSGVLDWKGWHTYPSEVSSSLSDAEDSSDDEAGQN